MFIFVERGGGVEKVQRMIDLQDDCPHPGCAGLDSTQHLRVRERLMRGDGVTSQD